MSGSAEYQHEADLSEAIEKTKGIQPWRRVFHAANGTLVVLALTVFDLEVSIAVGVLGVILSLAMVVDATRLFDPKLNIIFFRTFSSLASPREVRKIASSTWYVLSAFLVLLFFPKPYAMAGILVLAWADPAASVVGQRWGSTPVLSGTVLGTAIFALVAFAALLLFVPWWVALVAAGVTAVVEAAPIDLDDNLIVPFTVAGVLIILGG
jgi:dolichol kinase